MVDLALPRALNAIGQQAIAQAQRRRASSVDAEHLLLAIVADRASVAASRLAAAGLTYEILDSALDRERARSLGVASLGSVIADNLPALARTTTPAWGSSLRDVLRGADKSAAKSGRTDALQIELAAAVFRAPLGTVARALLLAGLGPEAMTTAVHEAD